MIIIKMALNEYKEMKKRGQVSFFMILGVLLVIIVGFVIYMTSFSTKERIKKEAITTSEMPRDIQEINNYVVSCLDRVTQDGLELIGNRSGMITTDEGGTYNSLLNMNGVNILMDGSVPVRYAIRNIWEIEGVNVFPPLYSLANTLYDNLKGYIKNALFDEAHGAGCLASSEVNYVFGKKGFEIIHEPPTLLVDLDVGNDDIKVHLTYPLKIKNKATGEKRDLTDFYVVEKIRLKKMHEFLDRLITREVNEKDFDLIAGKKASEVGGSASLGVGIGGFDGFKIKEVKRGVDGSKDDIIEVIDENSLLKGKPFLFRFARMNRKPILEIKYLTSTTHATNSDINAIRANKNDDVTVRLKAYDKDEDDLNIKFGINPSTGISGFSSTYTPISRNTENTKTAIVGDLGTYTVNVFISDNALEVYKTFTITVNNPPVASFTVTPTSGTAPLTVDVDASSSHDEGSINYYYWDWDYDGTTFNQDSTGIPPTPLPPQYTTSGIHTIALKVIDDEEEESSIETQTVDVNEPPTASFTYTVAGRKVSVNALDPISPSTDDGTITSYEWDWSYDGTSFNTEATGETQFHTYTAPGTYDVALRVTDDDSATDLHTITITLS